MSLILRNIFCLLSNASINQAVYFFVYSLLTEVLLQPASYVGRVLRVLLRLIYILYVKQKLWTSFLQKLCIGKSMKIGTIKFFT